MPDLDTGHLFLTTLAPIKAGKAGDGSNTSCEQKVRATLAMLPTALQSPATQNTGLNSPFSRNKRTHLARMFVLGDVIYNGRNAQNPVVATAKGINPVEPQEIDKLNAAYLVFCADIDAVTEDGAPLPHNLTAEEQTEVRKSYARKLWDTMGPELEEIYRNCVGFDGVDSADGFAEYLDRCHVETTMPFHDYYLKLPKFNELSVPKLLAAILVPAGIGLLALVLWLFGMSSLLGISTLLLFILGFIIAAVAAVLSARYALSNGSKPLPPGEYDDLPSVLKALYVQQTFADFAIDHQGADADKIYEDFGAFLETHKPADKMSPTQNPGVISITAEGGLSS